MITRRQREILHHLRFREAGETDPARQQCWLEQNRIGGYTLIVPDMTGDWAKSPFNIRKDTLHKLKTMGAVSVGKRDTMPKFPGQHWIPGYPIQLTAKGQALAKGPRE